MTEYQDFQVASAPPWQQTPAATAWNYCFGLIKQSFHWAAKLAVKARFPQYAPPDALDSIGQTLQIDRGLTKSDPAYVAQLMNAWTTWQKAGTVPGMTALLTAAGLVGVTIKESWYWSDGNPSYSFTVLCTTPTPWNTDPLADGTWASAGTWGDGGVWAGGIPPEDRRRLRSLIRKFMPTHAQCAAVIVTLGGGRYWGVGSGTWGDGGVWGGGKTLYINMTV